MPSLAHINLARFRFPLDHPEMAEFANRIAEINQLAEQSSGFIWRFTDDVDSLTFPPPYNGELVLVAMSVWDSVESLRAFVYESQHLELYRRRKEWVEKVTGPSMALWWIPDGTVPTLEEAFARLKEIEAHGDSETAFTFRETFAPPVEIC